MSNKFSPNLTDPGADAAQVFHASIDAARRHQRTFWLLSGLWLAAIVVVALQFSAQVSRLRAEQEDLKIQVAAARTAGEAARAATQGVGEVRQLMFALQGSLERRAEFDNRALSAKDKERFAIRLAEAEIDRQRLTATEQELLREQRERMSQGESLAALFLQGSALVTSNPKHAIAKLKAATTKDPNYEPAWAALGKAYRYDFDYTNADEALSRAINLNNSRTYTRAERCNVRINLEASPSDETMEDCAKAIELNSGDWVPYHYRAFGYYHRQRDTEAESDWRKAAALRDSPAGSLENLGLIYVRQRNWQEAFDNAQTVSLIDATSSWNWLILSIAADRLGRKDVSSKARDQWLQFGTEDDVHSLSALLPAEFKTSNTLEAKAAIR